MSLPLKPVEQLLAKNWPHQIRGEATGELKHFLEQIGNHISVEAVKEFENLNKRREKQGLPKLIRLHAWAVQKACRNVLKDSVVRDMGSQTQDVVNPGGNNMLADNDATKSASEDEHIEVQR